LKNSVKILKAAGEYVYEKLINFGVNVKKPSGGFYLMPELNDLLSDRFNNSR
jgi:hypothetical protein